MTVVKLAQKYPIRPQNLLKCPSGSFGKTMRRLGRKKHGQESVITKDKNKPARLHDTESKKPGKSINIGKSKGGSNPSGMGQTSGNKVRGKSLLANPRKERIIMSMSIN